MRPFLRERSSARRALLDAARRIAERDGPDAITLGSAADEAGFARTTAYANFSGRDELLQAIVADDLSFLLRAMRQVLGYPEPPAYPLPPSRVVRVAFQRADDETSSEGEVLVVTPADEDESFLTTPPSREDLLGPPDKSWSEAANDADDIPDDVIEAHPLPMVVENASWEEIDEGVIELTRECETAPAALNETLDHIGKPNPEGAGHIGLREVARVDAELVERLEQRVAVLEEKLLALEGNSQPSIQWAETTGIDASMDGASDGEVEKDSVKTVGAMTADIDEIGRRLDLLQALRQPFPAVSEVADGSCIGEPELGDDDLVLPPEDAAKGANAELQHESSVITIRAADFLSQARRAALSAESGGLSSMSKTTDAKRRKLRTRLTLGAIGAAALVLTGVALGLRYHVSAGKPAIDAIAPRHVYANGRATVRRTSIVLTGPIDQLTSRARAGEPDAELAVGLRYLAGEGTAKNEPEGSGWIARSALKGNTLAQYWLATLYEHGRGVTADPVQAFAWYEKAALGGNRKAMHNLAVAYAQGSGVAKNMEEAARWFSKAAGLGYVDSAFNLAVLYERGDGVPQSLLGAYKWYSIAANQGDAESKVRLSAMESELPPDALAAAQKAAASFQPVESEQEGASSPAASVPAKPLVPVQ